VSNFFADVSSKIIALADPVLSQPDIEREMVSPPAGAYIPSFTICHVLPDLPGTLDNTLDVMENIKNQRAGPRWPCLSNVFLSFYSVFERNYTDTLE
jgi:hypothetical protein